MKNMIGILLLLMVTLVPLGAQEPPPPTAPPATTSDQPQAAMDGFIPMSEMTTRELLPAAPLVFYAYGFVWIALLGYLWAIWRRVDRVEQDIARVRRRLDDGRGGQP
ncbi:MAG: hypothetical protein O2917_10520 [Acidobacteria bacterium]|nr:hypothetical protein [Acidobacteriota bacterium]